MHMRYAAAGKMWRCMPLVVILCLCAAPILAEEPDAPAFLQQMPEPGRVIADMRGSDDLDTAARRVAALNRFVDVVVVLSGTADAPGGPRLTREELALNGRYSGAASSVATAVYLSIDPDNKGQSAENSRRDQWNRLRDRYGRDGAFIRALLQRYLTPDLGEKYLGHMAQNQMTPPSVPKPVQGNVVQGKVVTGDISGADYKRDVEQAANLQLQQSQLARRALNNEIDGVTYAKSMKPLNSSLMALKAKWKAAGRGAEFERDYMKRVIAPAIAQADKESTARYARGILELIVGIPVAIVGLFYGLYRLSLLFKRAVPPVSTVYGTAHYATTELDVADDTCLERGLFLGKSSAPGLARLPLESPGAPVCTTPEHHTLIVARTRTGKGTRVIVPTLLRYAGSAFVIDPKGENTAITARVRGRRCTRTSMS
jgi:hypothetical protein